MVVLGEAIKIGPLAPVFHVIEPAQLLAVSIPLVPEQIEIELTAIDGVVVTEIVPKAEATQFTPTVQVAV